MEEAKGIYQQTTHEYNSLQSQGCVYASFVTFFHHSFWKSRWLHRLVWSQPMKIIPLSLTGSIAKNCLALNWNLPLCNLRPVFHLPHTRTTEYRWYLCDNISGTGRGLIICFHCPSSHFFLYCFNWNEWVVQHHYFLRCLFWTHCCPYHYRG